MSDALTDARWYHLVLFTYRRRPVFKLARHALFCERAVGQIGKRLGCPVDSVRAGPGSIHLLIRIPRQASVTRIVLTIKWLSRWTLAKNGVQPCWKRLWARSYWCASLTRPSSAAAVRQHIHQHRLTAGASAPHPLLSTPVTSEQPSRHHQPEEVQSPPVSGHTATEHRAP